MYLKTYEVEENIVVAVCDENIIGERFTDGDLTLKLEESFYKGSLASEDEVKDALRYATIANIAGKEAIACAVDCGCVDPDTIIFISGIPHAQMVRL